MIGTRRDSHKVIRKSLDTIWASLMGSDHHALVVSLEEGVKVVRAEVDDVVLLFGVSTVVVLESVFLFGFMGITPKKVEHLLMILRVILTQLDLNWSLDLLDTLDILDSWADTSVTAEDLLLLVGNNSCKRHLLKSLINLGEDRIWVIDILFESIGALITKTKIPIYVFIFVIASEKHNLFGILDLKGK